MNSYRTHTCNDLRLSDVGTDVTLIGWVDSVRDHGGVIFIDLRDRSGITQVVFHPDMNAEAAKASQSLRSEDMIQITGKVIERLKTDRRYDERRSADGGYRSDGHLPERDQQVRSFAFPAGSYGFQRRHPPQVPLS